ncbi:hypothetical protein DICPUDRAFT_96947 [Dictyostelium purpureum]|uniref:Peptidase A1 domain-containing protein n=1 Tax=Dictyostelium purpureum TaxID=5786 RepID=F0ZCL0_DICPU|nr:uncharacterized protein DICPUDRAFT_96947 [Dictyostelium purpureum]EGC38316.1 hypothetical protein DICPUDRAFT_96947 [Dictyostelium purpureum]|eukprot:XP_003285177.1 hypothetical protein DICPUDRAFT_96947 [Dictyostelium purpureum]
MINDKNENNNKKFNYNKITTTTTIIIIIIAIILTTSIDISECKSISISRKHKDIHLYHPETKELILTSTVNNKKISRQDIHYLINKNQYKNKLLITNHNDTNSNSSNINNNNNKTSKIYSFLKLKNNDYNHNITYYNLKKRNKDKEFQDDDDFNNNNLEFINDSNGSDNNSNNNNNSSNNDSSNNNYIKTSSSILYGGITSSFEYFIPILVGTPPQMFTVQVDTGSTSLAVPGSNCYLYKSQSIKTSCSCSDGNLDGLYSLEESISSNQLNCSDTSNCNTCKNNKSNKPCPFVLKYGDGSFIAGSLVIDHVTIGDFTVPAKFGNIQKESLSFSQLTCPSTQRSQAVRDGILGLSFQQLDPDNGDDIFSKIVAHYNIPNVFSMCLGKDGGLLTIGGTNDHITQETPKYTPIFDSHYYSITVTNIYVGNDSLNLAPPDLSTSIVDSGTTLLYFSDEIFYSIVRNLEEKHCELPGICNDPFWEGNCHHLEEKLISEYPTIYLEMKGMNGEPSFKLEVPPDLYFLNINGLYCFGISHMKEISVLIGDVVLQGYNVIYNRENSSIGFARTHGCSTKGNNNTSLMLSIESGNLQKSTEEERFASPLVLKLSDSKNKTAVSGIIVSFNVVGGNADFYPSHMSSIRNITDSNGIVSILVVPKLFGKIVIEATVWGNNNTNIVYFTLHSSMKPWKLILISISTIVCLLIILAIGLLIYKKKLRVFNKSYQSLPLNRKPYYDNDDNDDNDDFGENQEEDEFNNHHLSINTTELNSNINNNDNIINNNNNNLNDNSNNNNLNSNNNSKQSEWSIFSKSLINGLDIDGK